jgi:hypothetical protein
MELGSTIYIKQKFIKKDLFKELKNKVMDANFPWYYNEHDLSQIKSNNFMFTHTIYRDGNLNSNFYHLIKPICDKIYKKFKFKKILRIKLNCYTNQNKKIEHIKHNDVIDPLIQNNILVGVFHINTNNGKTIIDSDGGDMSIKSEENQIILFNNLYPHYGTTQTDTNLRVLINFNFLM